MHVKIYDTVMRHSFLNGRTGRGCLWISKLCDFLTVNAKYRCTVRNCGVQKTFLGTIFTVYPYILCATDTTPMRICCFVATQKLDHERTSSANNHFVHECSFGQSHIQTSTITKWQGNTGIYQEHCILCWNFNNVSKAASYPNHFHGCHSQYLPSLCIFWLLVHLE